MSVVLLNVSINLLPEEKSGKYGPVFPGTGCSIQFHDNQTWHCLQEFADREFAYPGEQCRASIRFLEPGIQPENLYKGKDFKLLEGDKQIGSGIVLEVHLIDEWA